MKTCPFCAERVLDHASVCRWCDSPLTDDAHTPPGGTAPPTPPHHEAPLAAPWPTPEASPPPPTPTPQSPADATAALFHEPPPTLDPDAPLDPDDAAAIGRPWLRPLLAIAAAGLVALIAAGALGAFWLYGRHRPSTPTRPPTPPASVDPPCDEAGARRIWSAENLDGTIDLLKRLNPDVRRCWAEPFDAHMHDLHALPPSTRDLCLLIAAVDAQPPPSERWTHLVTQCADWSKASAALKAAEDNNADAQDKLDRAKSALADANEEIERAQAEIELLALLVLGGRFFEAEPGALHEVADAALYDAADFLCADSRTCSAFGRPRPIAEAGFGERVAVRVAPGRDPMPWGNHLLVVERGAPTRVNLARGGTAEWLTFEEVDPAPLRRAQQRQLAALTRIRELEAEIADLRRRLKPTDALKDTLHRREVTLRTTAALRRPPPVIVEPEPPQPADDPPGTTPPPEPEPEPDPNPIEVEDTPLPSGNRAAATRLNAQGFQAWREGRLDDAHALYTRATRADPSFHLAWYNLACIEARRARPDDAAQALHNARRARPDADLKARVGGDPDFDALRNDPRFTRWLERW